MASLSAAKVIGQKPIRTLWDKICDEFAAQRAEFEEHSFDDSSSSVDTEITQYTSRKHTPVVYGKMIHKTPVDANVYEEFDPAISHPAAVGLSMINRPKPVQEPSPEPPVDIKNSTPKEFLEAHIFPTLIPGLMKMLQAAKEERCFTRKRTKFNACDFLTEYLYQNNPIFSNIEERSKTTVWDIPFAKAWLNDHPRSPLPLSVLWSDEEAAIKIQSFWRGYKVRTIPEIQELREWQKEWREEMEDVREKVDQFWTKKEEHGSPIESQANTIKSP